LNNSFPSWEGIKGWVFLHKIKKVNPPPTPPRREEKTTIKWLCLNTKYLVLKSLEL